MGNRVWIQIESRDFAEPVLIYGHYTGEDALEAVRNVIQRTDRIGDGTYLAAQIFHEFATNMGQYDGKLGFGIASGRVDEDQEENPTVYVDADDGQIIVNGELVVA